MKYGGWPFRSRLRKALFLSCLAIMLGAALIGLVSVLITREFGVWSIAAVTVGLGALLVAAGMVVAELLSQKWHPESGLFTWSDVDNLRLLAARSEVDDEVRSWARSLAERIAVVLPGRLRSPKPERPRERPDTPTL